MSGIGKAEGAKVLTGGRILDDGELGRGSFYAPTVLDDMTLDMRVAQEEIFGPVTGIVEVDSLEDALRAANAHPLWPVAVALHPRRHPRVPRH